MLKKLHASQMVHDYKWTQFHQHYKNEFYKAMAAVATGHEKEKLLDSALNPATQSGTSLLKKRSINKVIPRMLL